MCGIVGLISGSKNGFTGNERDTLRDMIFMDTLRGVDSTGLMYGTNSGAVQIHKDAVPGPVFLSSDEWKSSYTELFNQGKWAVAHNRAATRGSRIEANAHPFYVQNEEKSRSIILLQNGTYKGDHEVHAKTQTDTEACAHAIVKHEDASKALKTINAAYVFVWYDIEKKTLNVIRNDERPLFIARTKIGGVIFSSEYGILIAAATRNNLDLEDKPYLLNDSCLCQYEFKDRDYTGTFNKIDITYEHPFVLKKEVIGPPFQTSGEDTCVNDKEEQKPVQQQQTGRVFRLPHTPASTSNHRNILTLGDAMLLLKNEFVPTRGREFENGIRSAVVYARNNQETFVVEGVDYVKIDETNLNDKSYYVFGIIATPDESDILNGQLVSWMVDGSEREVLDYTLNHYFKVELDYLLTKNYAGGHLFCVVVKDDKIEIVGNRANEEVAH